MDNLATLLMVALVCVAFGFVAGSMLTSLWIDRHPTKTRSRRKAEEKQPEPFVKIFMDEKTRGPQIEFEGKNFSEEDKPNPKILAKFEPIADLMKVWFPGKDAIPTDVVVKEKTKKTPLSKAEKAELEKKEPRDMLFEINNIIQNMVKKDAITNRKVRLGREGNTGMVFWVDENCYKTLDEIPDAEIKQMVRKAVAEWETQAVI